MVASIAKTGSLRGLARAAILEQPTGWAETLTDCAEQPLPEDMALFELARTLGLTPIELCAVALAALADEDPLAAAELARLQAPQGRSRPLAGFIALRFSGLESPSALSLALTGGAAIASGLIELGPDSAPLLERQVSVPTHILHALNGIIRAPVGVSLQLLNIPLAPSAEREAIRFARSVRDGAFASLIIRSASADEARSAAHRISQLLRTPAAFIRSREVAALGPWLALCHLLPVYELDLAPGDTHDVVLPKGYTGPQLVVASPEGSIRIGGRPAVEWTLSVPAPEERAELWRGAIDDSLIAEKLAAHRHSASRIASLGRVAREIAAIDREPVSVDTFRRAAWSIERHALGHLAAPIEDEIGDDALILPESLRQTLDLVLARCRYRDGLDHDLGAAARTRYRTGVRLLFAGPSGTGKTLAAGWVAAKLKMPLFRVELAGVTSKYIGETEKNLAHLLNEAEQSEVVLLFDEADSLFGKRTAINDAHDRYANAQTNYLLQRIESFDGIAILTSNHESQLDPAFARRLDFVLEFANPSPAERRQLWISHLGTRHALTPQQINCLASSLDLAGGDIRNAVLHASALARDRNDRIGWVDVLTAVRLELRKLRLVCPSELAAQEF